MKTNRLIIEKNEAYEKAKENLEKEFEYKLEMLKRQINKLKRERRKHLEIDAKINAAKEGIEHLLNRLQKSRDTRYHLTSTSPPPGLFI